MRILALILVRMLCLRYVFSKRLYVACNLVRRVIPAPLPQNDLGQEPKFSPVGYLQRAIFSLSIAHAIF